jgi:hypothetical protein
VSAWLLPALAFLMQAPTGSSHLLVIAGVGGEPRYQEAFHEQATGLATAGRSRWGSPPRASGA